MVAGSDRFIGKLLGGTYQVGRLIGKGGMGAIYEASHARLRGNRYAIKVLAPRLTEEPELLVRFRREAEIASELGHEHIVAVHDFDVADGQAYMVMELLEGEDLAARLHARGALPIDEVVRVVDQVASALDAAHRAQIVHRDLKPQNIFLCRRAGSHDCVKVLDFGVSKVLDSSSVVTGDHALLGTPFYMSPEQADGRVQEIDARTDVFALGAIVWEMLTGRMAFAAPTLSAALYKVCSVDPPEVHRIRSDVPPALSLVLRRALAKDRVHRTPSVVQLAAELTASLAGVTLTGVPPAAGYGEAPPPSPGFAPLSNRELSMAVAGTVAAAVPQPPRPQTGWQSTASPLAASSGGLAPMPGWAPTMPSLSGAPLPAIRTSAGWPEAVPSAGGGGSSALASPSAPSAAMAAPVAASMIGSIVGPPPMEPRALAHATNALAVGSMVVPQRPSRLGFTVAVGAAAVVAGLGLWAALRGDRAIAPASPGASASGTVAASSANGIAGAGAAAPPGAEAAGSAQPMTRPAEPPVAPAAPAAPVTTRPAEPSAAPAAPAAPATTPEVAQVALFLAVQPPRAKPRITLGDEKVTGRLIHVPRSDSPRTLTAEAPGFVPFHRDVLPDRDQTIEIKLQRRAARAPATAAPAATTPARPDPAAGQPAIAESPTPRAQVGAPAPAAQPPPGAQPPPTAPVKPAAPPAPLPQAPPPKKTTGTIFDQ